MKLRGGRAGLEVALPDAADRHDLAHRRRQEHLVGGEQLCTPPLGAGVLPGVTRSFLLEIAPAHERELTVDELYAADELFITSSVREVMPVTSIDGRAVPKGPAAAGLQASLRSAT